MTDLTRRNFLIGSLGIAGFFALGDLTGCSGSAAWYQLDKFLSQDPSVIVKELEENQGFNYYGEQGSGKASSYDYVWGGIPKDPLTEAGVNETLVIHKGDMEAMSRDELLDGETITSAEIHFDTNAFSDGSVKSTVEDIIKKCGFGNKEVEGRHETGLNYLARGRCRLNGQDAYWGIDIYSLGFAVVGIWLNDGDIDIFENVKNHIEQ